MHEAVFRIPGEGLCEAATADADARATLWCNDHCDLLRVQGPDAAAVVEGLAAAVGVRERAADGADEVIVTEECLAGYAETTVEPTLARHGCLLVPPLRYADGEKRCRVLALTAESLSACYRDLLDAHDVIVEQKREVGAVTPGRSPLGEALPDLSPRQREVFLTAHEMGYYEVPRGTTTAEVGDAAGVGRRTAEHHLRKAEQKLAAAVAGAL